MRPYLGFVPGRMAAKAGVPGLGWRAGWSSGVRRGMRGMGGRERGGSQTTPTAKSKIRQCSDGTSACPNGTPKHGLIGHPTFSLTSRMTFSPPLPRKRGDAPHSESPPPRVHGKTSVTPNSLSCPRSCAPPGRKREERVPGDQFVRPLRRMSAVHRICRPPDQPSSGSAFQRPKLEPVDGRIPKGVQQIQAIRLPIQHPIGTGEVQRLAAEPAPFPVEQLDGPEFGYFGLTE